LFDDDCGVVVHASAGAPGRSPTRYAGPQATNSSKIEKMRARRCEDKNGSEFGRICCAIAMAERDESMAIERIVLKEKFWSSRGSGGLGTIWVLLPGS